MVGADKTSLPLAKLLVVLNRYNSFKRLLSDASNSFMRLILDASRSITKPEVNISSRFSKYDVVYKYYYAGLITCWLGRMLYASD